MRLIYILLVSTIFLNASTINLEEILQKLKSEHPMAKSIQEYELFYAAQNRAKSSREALLLTTDGTYAKPDLDKAGYEYSVGVEQSFMHPSVKDNIYKSAKYQSDAEILKLKHDFLLLENSVRLLYHINCLDREAIEQYKASYLSFETLYLKKEKAYQYGEISKKELLHLQIELNRLESEYKQYENQERTSRSNLESITLLPTFAESELSCRDTYAITDKLFIDNSEYSLQIDSLDKKIKSAHSDFNQYNTLFDSFALSASYLDEIDTKRFVVGVSIPLNFTTSLNEENRAAALHKIGIFEYEKQELKLKRLSEIKLFEKKLEQSFQNIEFVKSILKKYEDELMPLIEQGYRLGEDSAIEYLLSQRELWMYKKDLIGHYKNYYEILFELYSILEIKDKL